MASNAQKLSAAAEFINDAPPGEMTEVLGGNFLLSPTRLADLGGKTDIRTILEKSSDQEFASALEKYNTQQLMTFKTNESDRRVIPRSPSSRNV
jgi:hypothetical protein